MFLLLLACDGASPDTAAPPDFNYIPDYSDACLPTPSEAAAAQAVTAARVSTDTFLAASSFEVCSAEMTSSCTPCSTDPAAANYNALAHMLVEFDDWGAASAQAAMAAEGVGPEDLDDVFAASLAYPWRHLLVHGQQGAGVEIALSPGIAENCKLDDSCDGGLEYRLPLETLDASCGAFRNTLIGDFAVDAISTSIPGENPFGFQVPLVAPNDLPPVADFESVPQLGSWLQAQDTLTTLVASPSITVTETDDGTLCGRLDGYADPTSFTLLASGADALDPYTDETGGIPVTLTLELHATLVDTLEID